MSVDEREIYEKEVMRWRKRLEEASKELEEVSRLLRLKRVDITYHVDRFIKHSNEVLSGAEECNIDDILRAWCDMGISWDLIDKTLFEEIKKGEMDYRVYWGVEEICREIRVNTHALMKHLLREKCGCKFRW